ncbi:hypothetical protein FQR65_LT02786 [Abscondita terminalis]|nr:hypothetical protein FQR65_LT02786 [Abscondita terminalis]
MEESLKVNVCRACLAEEGEFQSVFVSDENSGLSIHLAEMIMAYTSLQITVGDGLPEQICSNCAKTVVHFYLFKQQCEESDSALRDQLNKSTNKMYKITEEQRLAAEALNIDPYLLDVVIKPEISEESSLPPVSLEETFDVSFSMNDNGSEVEEVDTKDNMESDVSLEVYTQTNHVNKLVKNYKPIEMFVCDICNKSFSHSKLLLRHQAMHEVKAEVKVPIENVMEDECGVDILIEEKFNPIDLCCLHCNKEFLNKEEFEAHVNQDITLENLKCQMRNKYFSKPSHLKRHKMQDTVKGYICKLCNKGFARKEQLVNHMNTHSGIKPHVCNICSKGFNQVSNLRDHMRTHNGEKPFLCSTCGKGFNQLGNLRQHIIRHSGVKAHLCSTCGNGFASKGELCAHVRKHTGARPFVCPVCNHGFTTSSSLTKHKRIHSGEKPYECEVCKMKFSRSGILARHKRTHTGEKPYICKFCTKGFSQSNDLSSHLRIHTGEKPYICDTCGQAFRQSSALKSHKKTHVDRSPIYEIEKQRNIVPLARNNFLNVIP